MVVLYHGDGIYSLYLHLGKFNSIPGQIVRGGDVIAYSGESGVAGQPHLHFAIKVNGSNVEPLGFIKLFNTYLAELANE
jgi:murein DD-endopeptidase MepM/ murein hydrolase activator NlpD